MTFHRFLTNCNSSKFYYFNFAYMVYNVEDWLKSLSFVPFPELEGIRDN